MNACRIGFAIVVSTMTLSSQMVQGHQSEPLPGGELRIITPEGGQAGVCPLRHTDVKADIIGFISRVRVRQVFYNPIDTKSRRSMSSRCRRTLRSMTW
ncbi:MAG: hypothetical protein V3W34_19650 [Phycisphaerae bacterium]